MAECTAWELQLVDPVNNHDKFYRFFVVDCQWVAQFGRNGTVGQFAVKGSVSPRMAMEDAANHSYTKEAKGYDRVGGDVKFDIPTDYLLALKGHGPFLDAQFRGAQGGLPTSPQRVDGSRAEARRLAKEAKESDDLMHTLLRMRETARASLAEAARPVRKPDVPEVNPGEIETTPVEVVQMSPIEVALAKAIQAKKANA